jgi:hypothetical protein
VALGSSDPVHQGVNTVLIVMHQQLQGLASATISLFR